jgi:hypothetical protein
MLIPSVMPHKNVTKDVWYILVQLSSLNNTMSMVSGVSVQVSGNTEDSLRRAPLGMLGA